MYDKIDEFAGIRYSVNGSSDASKFPPLYLSRGAKCWIETFECSFILKTGARLNQLYRRGVCLD